MRGGIKRFLLGEIFVIFIFCFEGNDIFNRLLLNFLRIDLYVDIINYKVRGRRKYILFFLWGWEWVLCLEMRLFSREKLIN